ncbi:DNA mismatch repair protein MutS [Rhodoblastus sphagnicola]|uniref:DNA mismatch repair protein MutS n=2 Tax=Rhodoblastus sphagnicola TaxID=333368 RepID=A0A2S6NC47_9HYPH|nr:DNA mismatch repair protein MutS [Rhodoblastus sphagnicola]PPQ32186.1 DNA mismatch repair protein MutS [Rhodoblastus sphagnicola]
MMAQYLEIKRDHQDCLLFYRMGDFYELFFEDAKLASQTLGIVLTKRGKHLGEDIPMCGVPIERSDDYLHKLIASGHRVAVCEQTEDPAEARKRGNKSVVKRGVIRLVTPGTLTEERLLEPGRANLLVALVRQRDQDEKSLFGLAAVDISTGAFDVYVTEFGALGALLARLEPREIVASETLLADAALLGRLQDGGAAITPLNEKAFFGRAAEKKLLDYYHLGTLDGLGPLSHLEINAAGLCLAYIEQTQFAAKPRLNRPSRVETRATLEIDAATRVNLELTRSQSGQRQGSLLSALDRTVTSAGARTLAEWLAAPLRDIEKIALRQDAIAFFVDDPLLRAELRKILRAAPDMARALGRLALDRGGPRDLAALRDGMFTAKQCGAVLAEKKPPFLLAKAVEFLADLDTALPQLLGAALADDLPLDRRGGNFISAAFDQQLDEARALRDESRRIIAALQGRYCEKAETRQLKIKHNNFLGYFIEVNQAQGEKLLKAPFNADFIHRQTMADAMRFSTTELSQLESRITNAADEALAIESRIFGELVAQALDKSAELEATASALAGLDVLTALAEAASEAGWSRPRVDNSLAFQIEAGRHPVVEAALRARGEPFVPNDCDLSGIMGAKGKDIGGKLAVITGPNMAGKSTFLRQNALIAILAQIGSFVPAKTAHIGVVDRLFSRVGASDDLARGRSTFMVEMVETAAILNQATEKSLVILDEIGRGTATYDGLSIAWAVMEHLHEVNRARALFATHFHELTHLRQKLSRLVNLCMRVSDWRGDVVFLHEVAQGSADRSYGVQVASLAGLPTTVVERARKILAELELNDLRTPVERLVADLPLFAAPLQAPEPKHKDALRDALAEIDPDDMTPRQALEALFNLKRVAAHD